MRRGIGSVKLMERGWTGLEEVLKDEETAREVESDERWVSTNEGEVLKGIGIGEDAGWEDELREAGDGVALAGFELDVDGGEVLLLPLG